MHTDPTHGAIVQPQPHRHLDRTGSYAASSDPRRPSPCPWRGTPHDAAAATSRCSDVARRLSSAPIIGRHGIRFVASDAVAGDRFPSLPALMPWVSGSEGG